MFFEAANTMNSRPLCLLVEDEPDVLTVSVSTLESVDIMCLTASDIQTAKQLLQSHTFDVCLTDVILPDGHGISELTRYIKIHYPNLPVVVFSASGGSFEERAQLKIAALTQDSIGKETFLLALFY
jgi:two-component system response regulator PilR (NtrC family)